MLVKVLALMLVIAIILALLYFMGIALYDHFVTRPAAKELEFHSNNLQSILKDYK